MHGGFESAHTKAMLQACSMGFVEPLGEPPMYPARAGTVLHSHRSDGPAGLRM